MLSGQGSHFRQVSTAAKKKKGKGRHRLAPPAARPPPVNGNQRANGTAVRTRPLADESYAAIKPAGKVPVERLSAEKIRPLSYVQGSDRVAPNGDANGHARNPPDTTRKLRGSMRRAPVTNGIPPSATGVQEDSKIGVHNERSAASKAAANAAYLGKGMPPKEHAQPSLSSMRAEKPRRDSTTLGTAHDQLGQRTAGVSSAAAPPVFVDSGTGMGEDDLEKRGQVEEDYSDNEWDDDQFQETAEAAELKPEAAAVKPEPEGPKIELKDQDEWVKEETEESPTRTIHTVHKHSQVTEYVPGGTVSGVSGQHVERKIEDDTVHKEIFEKVDNQAPKTEEPTAAPTPAPAPAPIPKPSYAAIVAKQREPSPIPAPAAPAAPVVPAVPEVPHAPTPTRIPSPPMPTPPPPIPAIAPVPVPAPIPVPLMKQEQAFPAGITEQPQAPAMSATSAAPVEQEVTPGLPANYQGPVVPVVGRPGGVVATDPVLPGTVPALASADVQVQAAVESSGIYKTSKEGAKQQGRVEKSQLTRKQRKEVEKEEKAMRKAKAKEQKMRDKEFKESQKQLRKGRTPRPDIGEPKKLGLRQRFANRLASLLS